MNQPWQNDREVILAMRLSRMMIGDSLISEDVNVPIRVDCVSDTISTSKIFNIYINDELTVRKRESSTLQFLLRNDATVALTIQRDGAVASLRNDDTVYLGYYPSTDSSVDKEDTNHFDFIDTIKTWINRAKVSRYRIFVSSEDASWS